MLEVVLVRDVTQLDEDRRNVMRLEDLEARRLERVLVHTGNVLHLVDESPGKAV
ncbi:Uncharacterised protein [Mycobacterium tuberculosis]|nr:Uncharacterised protein [Mycobacterium tuberculosis]